METQLPVKIKDLMNKFVKTLKEDITRFTLWRLRL